MLGIVLQLTGAINNFLTAQNMLNIIDAVSMLGIVAVGMAFVTYSGHYADLSVPTTMAMTGIVAVEMLKFGFVVAVLSALAVGFIVGLINAIAVGKFRANPIIWTLAVNYMSLGVIRLVWVNKQIYPDMTASTVRASEMFDAIFRLRFFDKIALPMVMMIVLVIVLQFVMRRTKFGVQLKMTGAAMTPARFSGNRRRSGGYLTESGRGLVQRRGVRVQGGDGRSDRRGDPGRWARFHHRRPWRCACNRNPQQHPDPSGCRDLLPGYDPGCHLHHRRFCQRAILAENGAGL